MPFLRKCFVVAAGIAVGLTGATANAGGNATLVGEFSPEAWQLWHDWEDLRQSAAGNYGLALRFAECVSRFDSKVPAQVMSRKLDDPRQRQDLVRLISRNRGCGTRVAVPPLLVRAAFAELLVRNAGPDIATAPTEVGVPAQIGTFPVARLAECQVTAAPHLVTVLLATRPGELEEDEAAKRLFGATPQCTSFARGGISPTAARLAIVSAAYRLRH